MQRYVMQRLVFVVLLSTLASVSLAAYYPDVVVNHHPKWLDQPAPPRKIPPIKQFFPLGVYGGSYGEQTWAFMLDDLRQHHMNCWWLNGGGLKDDDLDKLFTMGQQAGVRIYWQDNGDPRYYPSRSGTPESRRERHEREIDSLGRTANSAKNREAPM